MCEALVTCHWRLFSPPTACKHFFPLKLSSTPTTPPASASSAAHNDIQSVQEKKKPGGGEYFPLIYKEAELAENPAQGWVEGKPKSEFVMHRQTLPLGWCQPAQQPRPPEKLCRFHLCAQGILLPGTLLSLRKHTPTVCAKSHSVLI